jgi:hypothetical protein
MVLNTIFFQMAPDCKPEDQLVGHCGTFNQLELRFKVIIIANLKIYYAKFEAVMNEETGCPEQQKRYKIQSNQTWKKWMEGGGLVRTMLTCRGSDDKVDNIPHFTKQMQVSLTQKHLTPEGSLTQSDRTAIMKWTAASGRKQTVDEMVKEWEGMWACKQHFRDVSDDVLARWCYGLWRVCGFNIASAVKKMQHWFQARRKIWKKKNCKNNPVSASAEEASGWKQTVDETNVKKRKHAGEHPATSQGGQDVVAEMQAKAKNGDPAATKYLAMYYSKLAAKADATKPVALLETSSVVPLVKNPNCKQPSPLKSLMSMQPKPQSGEVWGYGDFADKNGGLLARITVLDGNPDTGSIKSVKIGTCVWVEPFYFTHTPHYR